MQQFFSDSTKNNLINAIDGLIDTKALEKMGPLVVGLLTGLSEVERSLIQERSKESYRSIKEQTGLALATITRIIKEQEVDE